MYKTYKLILLPADKENIVTRHTVEKFGVKIVKSNNLSRLYQYDESKWKYKDEISYTPHHLYLLSDEKIEEGDWKFNSKLNCITQHLREGKGLPDELKLANDYCKKIIATTDSSLEISNNFGYTQLLPNTKDFKFYLPQLPQSFIDLFISEYNKGNIIEEVGVEWQETRGILGVDIDNTISIKPIKDSYNKEQMRGYCSTAFIAGYANGSLSMDRMLEVHNQWLKENL